MVIINRLLLFYSLGHYWANFYITTIPDNCLKTTIKFFRSSEIVVLSIPLSIPGTG